MTKLKLLCNTTEASGNHRVKGYCDGWRKTGDIYVLLKLFNICCLATSAIMQVASTTTKNPREKQQAVPFPISETAVMYSS
jgi:hypothetical protein